MTFVSKVSLVLVFTMFFGLSAAFAGSEEDRTANRSVTGMIFVPAWVFSKPEHAEFLPKDSNWDQQRQHPAAWAGQDWDPSKWRSGWTPETAIKKFFKARIFERLYMGEGKVPVVELGPTFYKLSDLDQRRTLKLLTGQDSIFKKGFKIVELVDWSTHDTVGAYTPKGMFLN